MENDLEWNRIEDAALAILYLTLHDGNRVWKQIDWDITDRLHEQGMIADPRNKAKSLVLTPEGLERAERKFRELFERRSAD
ncbi:MAG: DUF6429 family protein [Wenzhouxiangellaceae bacterium]|nr:DUF6429 family protein [Wenzhouxiangellaceae bacterium]